MLCANGKGQNAHDNLKCSGPSRKIYVDDLGYLKRQTKGNAPYCGEIMSDLNAASLTKPVTTRTVRNYLKELGFEYVVKVKKQWLNVEHRQKRVA